MQINFLSFWYLGLFLLKKIRKNSILVIEPNDVHGEVVSGYLKYLQDLGYNVDVMMKNTILHEKPFARFDLKKVRVYCFGSNRLQNVLKLQKINQYKYIFLTSTQVYIPLQSAFAPDELGLSNKSDKIILVEHETANIAVYPLEQKLSSEGRVITLANLKGGTKVNPHYFGDVKITPKNKTTNFVVVGAIDRKRRNYQLLLSVMENLVAKKEDFKVTVIGSKTADAFPKELKKYVDFKGRLNFPKMYREMEKADFFLTLLDPENEAHNRYVSTGVSGSIQLILGFGKPCLISKKFADFYGFEANNAVVYEGNDLTSAMQTAVQMNEKEYANLQSNLLALSAKTYAESLQNLERILR